MPWSIVKQAIYLQCQSRMNRFVGFNITYPKFCHVLNRQNSINNHLTHVFFGTKVY